MILHSLAELYDRLKENPEYEITPQGYSPQKIGFKIILRPDGTLFDIQDARQPQEKGKPVALTQPVFGDAKPSGAGINPCFLWDKASYILGFDPDDSKPERTLKAYESFRDKHLALADEIPNPAFSAVCKFLQNWTPAQAQELLSEKTALHEAFINFGVFYIQGALHPVHAEPQIKAWWESRLEQGDALGQCIVTGEKNVPIARLHPKIKSVAGAQSAGANIVSFNDDPYESYGFKQSFNAPTSEQVAFKYGVALNNLLTGPMSAKHRLRIGDTTCVFWTSKPSIVEDVFAGLFSDGSNAVNEVQDENQRSKIQQVLTAIQQGISVDPELNDTEFYILGLAPNAARLSVRFFQQSTIQEIIVRLHQHLQNISIVKEFEKQVGKRAPDPDLPPNWLLLSQTARESKEIPPLLAGSLMRAILDGVNYPEALYSAVLRRIRADRTVNYLRACIIKGTLTRNYELTISHMLDPNNTDSAYLLGRLFATLEKTQDSALGELNAGVRDKFYSTASMTPASVFSRLLRTYQHHLAKVPTGSLAQKIGSENARGYQTKLDKLTQEILSHIPSSGFPKQFDLKQQGIFAIGYYHQRKAFYPNTESDKQD